MTTARTASPRTARAINDRIALDLLAGRGPLTAARLRELTGLSRPSVADLLDRLRRDGLVTVVGESGASRPGPNARLYGLVAGRAHVAALDVRTDSVAFVLADLTGRTVARDLLDAAGGTRGRATGASADGDRTIRSVMAALEAALQAAGAPALHTVVLGVPGLIDPASGALRGPGALPGWHPQLLSALRERFDGAVLPENEVNLAAVAEHRLGAVQDRDTFVLMWLGHGVGAAVVLDGALRRGASGGTGEIGFLPVPGDGGMPSAHGCDGGFHALAGSAAVCELARACGLPAADEGDAPAAESVVRNAVAAPDSGQAAEFLRRLADRIAVGAAAVTSVLDPGCVVLGGEVGRAGGEVLARAVGRRLAEISPLPTQVAAATVTGSPVLSGALVTALDAVREELFTADDAGG